MTKPAAPDSSKPAWWKIFLAEIEKLQPREQPEQLAALAAELITRRERGTAARLMLRGLRQLQQNHAAAGRKFCAVLRALTPRYHIQISTDPCRIAAWEKALAATIKPGMLVLEIGTGTGILAMLAARAGAEVVTCDSDILIAAMAEEAIRKNGLDGRIRVVAKPVAELRIPQDLPRPADLLILDLFNDRLFDFNLQPFHAIRDAKQLLRQDAAAMPMRVSLEGALADFDRWSRIMPRQMSGLDLRGYEALSIPHNYFDAADSALALRSPSLTMIGAELPGSFPPPTGTVEKTFASHGGRINGLAVWLRLELAPGHVLEARPGGVPAGFYVKPFFCAFPEPIHTVAGQGCTVRLTWEDKSLWLEFAGTAED